MNVSEIGIVPYFCPKCIPDSRTFATLSGLRAHLQDDHVYRSPGPGDSASVGTLDRPGSRTPDRVLLRKGSADSVFRYVDRVTRQPDTTRRRLPEVKPERQAEWRMVTTEKQIPVPEVTSKVMGNRMKGLRNALTKAHNDILKLTEERKTLHQEMLELCQKVKRQEDEKLKKAKMANIGIQNVPTTRNIHVTATPGELGEDEAYLPMYLSPVDGHNARDSAVENIYEEIPGSRYENLQEKEREMEEMERQSKERLEQEVQKREEVENRKEKEKEEMAGRCKQLEGEIERLNIKLEKNQDKVRTLMDMVDVKSEEESTVTKKYREEIKNISTLLHEKEAHVERMKMDAVRNQEFMKKISEKETLARQELEEFISGLFIQLEEKDTQLRRWQRQSLINSSTLGYPSSTPFYNADPPESIVTGYPGYHELTEPRSPPTEAHTVYRPTRTTADFLTHYNEFDTSGVGTLSELDISGHKLRGYHRDDHYDTDETDIDEDLPFDDNGILWDETTIKKRYHHH